MSKVFKVGDVCVGQNFVQFPQYNGEEFVIQGYIGFAPCWDNKEDVREWWLVRDKDSNERHAPTQCLRLKRPPRRDIDEIVSWESVGWMPMDVKLDRAIKESLWDQVREKA